MTVHIKDTCLAKKRTIFNFSEHRPLPDYCYIEPFPTFPIILPPPHLFGTQEYAKRSKINFDQLQSNGMMNMKSRQYPTKIGLIHEIPSWDQLQSNGMMNMKSRQYPTKIGLIHEIPSWDQLQSNGMMNMKSRQYPTKIGLIHEIPSWDQLQSNGIMNMKSRQYPTKIGLIHEIPSWDQTYPYKDFVLVVAMTCLFPTKCKTYSLPSRTHQIDLIFLMNIDGFYNCLFQ